jgi:hypothetical protein
VPYIFRIKKKKKTDIFPNETTSQTGTNQLTQLIVRINQPRGPYMQQITKSLGGKPPG